MEVKPGLTRRVRPGLGNRHGASASARHHDEGRVDSSLPELSLPCRVRLQVTCGHPLATGTAHLHGVRVAQGGRARECS